MTKEFPGQQSLTESVRCPYQGLFIDFLFLSCISKDNDGNIIEPSCKDLEGFNSKTAWIIISDVQTKMMHADTLLSKFSPLKYLELFLQGIHQIAATRFFS